MKNRNERLDVLRQILTDQEVSNQTALLRALAKRGFKMTQATLSRDLRQLQVAKLSTGDGYLYVLPENPLYRRISNAVPEPQKRSTGGYRSILFSGNLAIIHTRPGYAGALSSEIDSARLFCVLGSIAGDDTILLVLAEGTTQRELKSELKRVITELEHEG